MINPGRESNIPTSSGTVSGTGVFGKPLFKINGMSITVGIILLILAAMLFYQMMFTKRRRR